MFSVKVTNINWVPVLHPFSGAIPVFAPDLFEEEKDLPRTVNVDVRTNCEACVVDADIEQVIGDTLSDEWGWLHDGFDWERTPVPHART